ncbi:hypothetical protein GJU40_13655 [Bacillus lacus]|uniref:Uncharacterized protein n=1 Tax=Metabacillus lacus TaxID=1983721 RepID=A0A7X2LY35_9BACI|nr:hypothetical protein [Metabacillus lacus]MRX73190.1 hypothetical protein [Metabacillus lacus]
MSGLKRYYLSEKQREDFESILMRRLEPEDSEFVYQLDDHELLYQLNQ